MDGIERVNVLDVFVDPNFQVFFLGKSVGPGKALFARLHSVRIFADLVQFEPLFRLALSEMDFMFSPVFICIRRFGL